MALFSRRRRLPERELGAGLHSEVALVADRDTRTLDRLRALTYGVGLPLQGARGTVGYDRGDPATSLTGAVPRAPYAGPSAALRAVTRPADAATLAGGASSLTAPTPEFSDQASTAGNEFAGWQALAYHRIAR